MTTDWDMQVVRWSACNSNTRHERVNLTCPLPMPPTFLVYCGIAAAGVLEVESTTKGEK